MISAIPETLLSIDRAKRAVSALKAFLRGWKNPSATEALPSLKDGQAFAPLKTAVDAAKEAFDANPTNAVAEARLAFAVAQYRDTRYANAGRIHLGRLAWNNRVRGAFEGAKICKDHSIT